jgi:hypothetical protein
MCGTSFDTFSEFKFIDRLLQNYQNITSFSTENRVIIHKYVMNMFFDTCNKIIYQMNQTASFSK